MPGVGPCKRCSNNWRAGSHAGSNPAVHKAALRRLLMGASAAGPHHVKLLCWQGVGWGKKTETRQGVGESAPHLHVRRTCHRPEPCQSPARLMAFREMRAAASCRLHSNGCVPASRARAPWPAPPMTCSRARRRVLTPIAEMDFMLRERLQNTRRRMSRGDAHTWSVHTGCSSAGVGVQAAAEGGPWAPSVRGRCMQQRCGIAIQSGRQMCLRSQRAEVAARAAHLSRRLEAAGRPRSPCHAARRPRWWQPGPLQPQARRYRCCRRRFPPL